ncbi:hypothetical protein [Pantanalinema rosaneae]|uniref:hypothetical protein n=1 Tax=Pantanalinema rosaneae TaxID=1620701 RepID=UPI003D6F01CD
MVIADLNYLESTTELSKIEGGRRGLVRFNTNQFNISYLSQSATANAGNSSGISIGNTAIALNIATIIQINV